MSSKSFLFSSESVTEGHPDKVADRVSDAVLDAYLAQDSESLVACETLVSTGLVVLAGEISTRGREAIDFQRIVRAAIRDIGYVHAGEGFDADSCAVLSSLHEQSRDIRQGVERGHEIGAGDQGMMFGYACNETPTLMPMPIALSHAITAKLAHLRKGGELPWLRPDGKAQVTVEYRDGKPHRVHTVVVSTQHEEKISQEEISAAVKERVLKAVLPEELLRGEVKLHVNPTGRFVTGGPHGDSGLTGRKIIVDTYGGFAPHGGGAFSGKDPTKVDRSAAYMARYVAKNVVAAGLAERLQVQVAYAIGVAEPVSVYVEDFGTARVDLVRLEKVIRDLFPLKPADLIRHLNLRRPIYAKTSAYGHFGRELPEFAWEKTDKVAELQKLFK
ncbi:MAG: methionine adenosyltransferase [Bdellovibrionales bacterium]|nr:methionine adenosyltransferase [Bdellovibrionales bacterium]